MPTYGLRPDDVVTDTRGNVLEGSLVKFYPSRDDARNQLNLLGSAYTDASGRWSYTTDVEPVWARTANGLEWMVMAEDSDPYDPAGTAAAAVATHEAAADPHPQYLTQADGDSRYDPLGGGGGVDLSSYPDATGLVAGKMPQSNGADGWSFIDTPSGGGGGATAVAVADVMDYSFDVDLFNGTTPAAAQVVPTPSSPTGGECTHPSVVFIPEGFGGYRYWMAFTPYHGNDDSMEDPCVVASQDGDSWEVPAGLTNPLDDQPGSPGAYNSDTDLVLGPDGLLYLFWRTFDPAATGAEEHLYVRTSADGVTWTAKQTVFTADQSTERLLSPTYVYDQGVWHMWYVDAVPSPYKVRHRTATSPTGTWSAATACTTSTPAGTDPWHISVRRVGSSYVGSLSTTTSGATGTGGDLLLISSLDGVAFDVSTAAVIPTAASGLYNNPYRASAVPMVRSGKVGLDIWYGAYLTSGGPSWHIYRTHLAADAGVTGGTTGAGTYLLVESAAAADYTTTSTTFVDLDNTYFNVSIAAVVGDLITIEFESEVYQSTAGQSVILCPYINGVAPATHAIGWDVRPVATGTLVPARVRLSFVVASGHLSAGSVPIKMRWKTGGSGTATMRTSLSGAAYFQPQLLVRNLGQ